MRGGKRTVKWLDAEFPRVLIETIGIHQRNRTEPANVGVVKSSTVVEVETQRRIAEVGGGETPVIDEQRARAQARQMAGLLILQQFFSGTSRLTFMRQTPR